MCTYTHKHTHKRHCHFQASRLPQPRIAQNRPPGIDVESTAYELSADYSFPPSLKIKAVMDELLVPFIWPACARRRRENIEPPPKGGERDEDRLRVSLSRLEKRPAYRIVQVMDVGMQ